MIIQPFQPNRFASRPVTFQGSVQQKLRKYEQTDVPRLQQNLDPQGQRELSLFLNRLKQQIGKKNLQTSILQKPLGEYAFLTWNNPAGFGSRSPKNTSRTQQSPNGLFYFDTQHLDQFSIALKDGSPLVLQDLKSQANEAQYHYTVHRHPELKIQRNEKLNGHQLLENLVLTNNSTAPQTVEITLGSLAKDSYETRWNPNTEAQSPLVLQRDYQPAQIHENTATFSVNSAYPTGEKPNNTLGTTITVGKAKGVRYRFVPNPDAPETSVTLQVTVPPKKGTKAGQGTLSLQITPFNTLLEKNLPTPTDKGPCHKAFPSVTVKGSPAIDHLQRFWQTAQHDIHRLMIPIACGKESFLVPSAGYPNFGRFFGRDSLITAYQTLPYNPTVAAHVLQALAYHQGKKHNVFTEEAPGKILHEMSYGEPARLGVIPHGPYYGSEDSTPLFLMLMNAYVQQTGDIKLLEKLWPNVQQALEWTEKQVNDEKNPLHGFLPQRRGRFPRNIDMIGALMHGKAKNNEFVGLFTSTWKDHQPSFRLLEGPDKTLTFPEYPIAPAELQAYLYGAWTAAANLFNIKANQGSAQEAVSFRKQATAFQAKASDLKRRFNEKFWSQKNQFMGIALDGKGNLMDAVSSNGAQALWTGIVDQPKARRMAHRLMQKDMQSGWGIRTLSAQHPAYDPVSYHNGSVWPHDTSLIIDGLTRYGFTKEAKTLLEQVLGASRHFPNNRLPEVYSGFNREPRDRSILAYPDTCTIQAWACGAPFLMLSSLLGLKIDSNNRQITLTNPVLPKGVNTLQLNGLHMSPKETVDLVVRRVKGDHLQVVKTHGSKNTSVKVIQNA